MERHVTVLPEAQAFVVQLLGAGGFLSNLLEGLAAALVENGAERDAADEEVFEMLLGTVAVRLSSVPAADFARATEVIEQTLEGVFVDLDRALRRQKRRRAPRRRRAAHGRSR